jgi:hypothetical protein
MAGGGRPGEKEEAMERSNELRRATLRREISICRKLMEDGYYPYLIRFGNNGGLELSARNSIDTDTKLLDNMVRELADLDSSAPYRS